MYGGKTEKGKKSGLKVTLIPYPLSWILVGITLRIVQRSRMYAHNSCVYIW